MAAVLTPKLGASRTTDILQPTKYIVQLGTSLRDPKTRKARYSSTTFNHKPSQTTSKRSTTITHVDDKNPFNLIIRDEVDHGEDGANNQKYQYVGQEQASENSYVLTYDESTQSYTLDKLTSQYNFNMVAAPWEGDRAKLQQDYPQVSAQEIAEADDEPGTTQHSEHRQYEENQEEIHNGEVSGLYQGEEDGEPDPDNPFDWRHYITMFANKHADVSRNPSNANTPLMRPKSGQGFGSPLVAPRPSTGTIVSNARSPASMPARSPAPVSQRASGSSLRSKAAASPFFKKERASRKRAISGASRPGVDKHSSIASGSEDELVDNSHRDARGLGIDMTGMSSARNNERASKRARSEPQNSADRKQRTEKLPHGRSAERPNDRPRPRPRNLNPNDVIDIDIDEVSAFGASGDDEDETEVDRQTNDEHQLRDSPRTYNDVDEQTADDDDGDVDDFSLPGPAVRGEALRRQSTWDADAVAALELALQEQDNGDDVEEEEVQGVGSVGTAATLSRKADSDSESEEE